jgi:adenylate cyclase
MDIYNESVSELSFRDAMPSQEEGERQRSVVHTISWYAILISLSYAVLYFLLSFHALMVFTLVLGGLYTAVFLMTKRSNVPVRPLGVFFMFVVLLHTSALGLLFLPAATGLHLWILVTPLFSIISIDRRDGIWTAFFSVASVGILTYLEWRKEIYVPPFLVEFPDVLIPAIRAFGILVIVLFITGIFWVHHRNLANARLALQLSYERSEALLLNILPAAIAERLKRNAEIIADDFDEASVLFCDLVGFTTIASKQTAHETVEMLNGVFVAFDEAIERRGLEKIKTIGDAYMVASGVPSPRADHAIQLVYLALDLFQILEKYNAEHGYSLSLRIGINCGPVTAGVIGKRKFSYDLWGDTVNVASRMESTGIPNHIHVSEAVVEASAGAFEFQQREEITVKGKGIMQTYLFVGES